MNIKDILTNKKTTLAALGLSAMLSATAQNIVKGDYAYLY